VIRPKSGGEQTEEEGKAQKNRRKMDNGSDDEKWEDFFGEFTLQSITPLISPSA
jgi:hypothetical protein